MFKQISIIGPGLLGASLALALKEAGAVDRVHVWSRKPATRARALQTEWCDAIHDKAGLACEGSDLVVLCTPVDTIVPLLKEIAPSLSPGALITDVGSTKSQICREARSALGQNGTFIGSHPMAGSELTGMEHAYANLFKGASCIITPLEDSPKTEIARVIRIWDELGMKTATHSPEKHDEIVANISHLPHLLASSLCSYLASKESTWKHLAGGGLRDTTRIAAGDATLWKQILEQNREEILGAIDGFEAELHKVKSALLSNDSLDLTARLERGRKYRQDF